MKGQDPFDGLERRLRRGVRHAHGTSRSWWRTRLAGFVIAGGLVAAGGGAIAATQLLSSGSPVPYERGAPVPGRADGAPLPGTVRLLASAVADPDGGAPWGVRFWETDRGYACLQVGRVHDGALGHISARNVFHELRPGVTAGALAGCFVKDARGHAFAALHADVEVGGQPQNCPTGVRPGTVLQGRDGPVRCRPGERTVDVGLLGPRARSFSFRAAGRQQRAEPLGRVGGYLIVQRRLKPVLRRVGVRHREPRHDVWGAAEPYLAQTPGSQVLRTIAYRDGTCRVRITTDPRGSCFDLAGFAPLPVPRAGEVRSRVRAFAAPGGRGIRVRFRAREPVVDARRGYVIEVRPAEGRGFTTQPYARNVRAGDIVRKTVDLYNGRRGRYRIVVRLRTMPPRPGPMGALSHPGLLVGQTTVTVP